MTERNEKPHRHNDFVFRQDGKEVALIRDFEGMYAYCEDPHGQSQAVDNLSYQLVLATLDRAVRMLAKGAQRPAAIIDIGCGLGYFTARIKQRFPDVRVCGVDISPTALKRARLIAPDCVFQQLDLKAPETEIEDAKRFDIAVALDILYYFEPHEIDGVMFNINKLLAENGYLLVGYHLPEDMRFGLYIRSLDDARLLLAKHAMDIVYSFDVQNRLDVSYDGSARGRHLYFLAKKSSAS
ncbi:MAG: class I SAM-dependent methyltransferase [Gammaproteobacteria bacterium]